MTNVHPWKAAASFALAVLSAASAAGCGMFSKSSGGQKTETADEAAGQGIRTVSFINYVYDDVPPLEGASLKMIRDRFRLQIKPQFVSQTDYTSKLSVLMASGSIPDVVSLKDLDSNYFNWAKQGAFLPLDEFYERYPTLKQVPEYVREQFRVDGRLYGIPRYYPGQYTFVMILRKDWLDRLQLAVPTSYEELKKVAIAFTRNDPDGNGRDDTYGMALSQSIGPDYNAGAYWSPDAWYHKDEHGRYIPGIVGPGRREVIGMLADLYKAGAVTKDFAVLNWAQGNNEFYTGKAGIFIGTPRGMSETYMETLLKLNPEATFAFVEPFQAPDGFRGYNSQSGFLGITALSSELADDPGKVKAIMDVIDFGRTFIPPAERKPNNPDYDWRMGGLGQGYFTDANGAVTYTKISEGKIPASYLFDSFMWAPGDEANQYSAYYIIPRLKELTARLEDMFVRYKDRTYINPASGIVTPARSQKETELTKYALGEQTKMIVGQRPLSDWDAMTKEWMDRGGAELIKEVNDSIRERRQ
ncbi:extracellular solute-binding protein [Paenibacillus flagellatus]|uniref:ABC transporter substrate-binding protein n=1 Tax=Paenibacillus flagellatus TaxID=2211139 RepID=A0A2V5K1G2_9BACL|nr:extracellular solute-binding protein [Paenibacillus flagellatus]PYI51363.1 ABC transporter substrate-binding protein [Paenibacillus flagellatus]